MTALALAWGILSMPGLPDFRVGLAVVAVAVVISLALPVLRAQRAALTLRSQQGSSKPRFTPH